MVLLFILAPLAGLVLLAFPVKGFQRSFSFRLALLIAAAQALCAILLPAETWNRGGGQELVQSLRLAADHLSLVLIFTIGVVVFAAALVGSRMIENGSQRFLFFNVLLVSMIGMNGAVLVTDIFSLYVFLEIIAVSSFLLVAFRRDKDALEGAFKYLILSAIATVLMLMGIALMVLAAHGTSFDAIRNAVVGAGGNTLVKIGIASFISGLLIKGGLVPFHGWVPGAYSAASAPVSILLAGIATKVSGIYALVRIAGDLFAGIPAFNELLLFVGVISIVVGAFAALVQSDMKRMLAYSSISQVGYILLGLGCGSALGFVGAVFHLFNHAIFKSLLFVNSAAVEQQLGTTDMNKAGGLGSRMPWTARTSVVGLLSASGVPPLSGFWSKLIILIALWQTGHPIYAALALLLSVVTLAYLLIMQRRVFFGKTRPEHSGVHEAGTETVVAEIILASITVGFGLFSPLWFDRFLAWAPQIMQMGK